MKVTGHDSVGMTKYRKEPQRTHKRPTEDRKGALHRTTIMRKLPDLATILFNLKKCFVYFFVILYFFVFFVNV